MQFALGLSLLFASLKDTHKNQIFNYYVAYACQLVMLANLAKKLVAYCWLKSAKKLNFTIRAL